MDFTRFLVIRIAIIFLILSEILTSTNGASKYTDETRPYEFGFNIEGMQHRREKKDENGIIMGEFGFITADGVYHVTVYATDENGNFKILSMKNIRLNPAPPGTTPVPLQTLPPIRATAPPPARAPARAPALAPASVQISAPIKDLPQQDQPPPPPPNTPRPFTTPKPLKVSACASCKIPSTTKAPPPQFPPQTQSQYPQKPQSQYPQSPQSQYPQTPQSQYPQKPQSQYPQTPQSQYPGQLPGQSQYPGQSPGQSQYPGQSPGQSQYPGQSPRQSQYPEQPNPMQNEVRPGLSEILEPPQGDQYNPNNDPTGLGKPFPGKDGKPVKLISGSMQIVDPDVYQNDKLKPGEQPGLPLSISEDNMSDLLYRFNYTVGFHGHWEEGYSNGVKVGGYYVNNRNGVATKITYRADDTGYHPKIERVKISPEETPVEETEKNPEFGLKGYEFKWFYVPKFHYLNHMS